MQGIKLEFLNKYNYLFKQAEKGFDHFADELCEFVASEFDLHAAVLFKNIDESKLIVLGKSSFAKKNYIKGSYSSCSQCKLIHDIKYSNGFYSNPECDIQASEFVMYEICCSIKIAEDRKLFLKAAKKSPFVQNDIDELNTLCDFIADLMKIWFSSRGERSFAGDKSVSEILADVSQSIRTPINNIIGFSSILTEDSLTSPQIEYISNIKNNAQYLSLILNDLIDIAKIESGSSREDKSSVNLPKFIEEVTGALLAKEENAGFKIKIDIDEKVSRNIKTDAQKLRFILTNIFLQTFLSPKQNSILLKIWLGAGSSLRFKIFNANEVISPENLRNIFQPVTLSQFNNQKDKYGGAINLTLVRKYISFLRGDIEISSTETGGASYDFNIYYEPVSPLEENLGSIQSQTAGNKVLVIENDYAASKLLSNYLNKWGYEPVIVTSPEQTLSVLEREEFLAIIMDIVLEEANGLELLKKIHEHKKAKNTPVIICSIEAEQQKAFMLGAVDYFVKPIQYKYLVEALTSYKLKRNSNILCVDDDVPTLNLLKEAIHSAGYNPVAENVSANVIDRIKDMDIDLAIIDLDMPEPNGFELIKKIKTVPRFAKTPIIIYTGKENYQDDLAQIDGLFEELFSKKSVNMNELSDTIKGMINSKYESPVTLEDVKEKQGEIKILLAEDYKHSQIIVTRLLKKSGFENVVVVENGEEALNAVTNESFNLILMDMQMPVMNGFEATEKIRELDSYKNTPIIALTAFAMKGDREKCLQTGATDYIPKPIDSKEFIEKVKYYLEKQS
jgi:CheY-like chemotaxis protein